MNDDAVLLRRYVAEKSEEAFAEIVRRHLGFVYAAALRRLNGDSHGAADVAQTVFIKLARDAAKLSRHSALAGWLYTTTRNAAVDWVRVEQHRKAREQEIAAMQESVSSFEPMKEWERVRPLLDVAMDELEERDRTVILLRFFARHRFSDIGVALRISEDAARMRTDRALEKLHGLLKRRGVTSSSVALGAVLTTQAGASAVTLPAGLMGSVTTTALANATVLAGALPSVAATFVSMTTKKLAFGSAALIGVVGLTTIVYQSNRTDDPKVSPPTVSSAHSVAAADPVPQSSTAGQLHTLQQENQRLRALVDSISGSAGSTVVEKVSKLRTMLENLPDQGIPELKLLTEDDWYAAIDGPLESTEDYRLALSKLRGRAENRFAKVLFPMLQGYIRANGGKFPSDTSQLQPFISGDIDVAMLQRYKVVPQSVIPNVRMGGDSVMTQVGLVDSQYDQTSVIGPRGTGTTSVPPGLLQEQSLIMPAIRAYQEANGSRHTDILQVLPYATTPEQQAIIQKWAQRPKGKP